MYSMAPTGEGHNSLYIFTTLAGHLSSLELTVCCCLAQYCVLKIRDYVSTEFGKALQYR